MMLEI